MSEGGISAGKAFDAAGVTRGEVAEWYKREWLHIPPRNPAARAARRYSVANVAEMFLFKSLAVAERVVVKHEAAAALIGERLERARKDARISSLADLNRPEKLAKTEFSTEAHGRVEGGFVYWVITETGKGGAIFSTWDSPKASLGEFATECLASGHKALIFPLTLWLGGLENRVAGRIRFTD